MKNNLVKYYIVAVYLCSTFVLFAAGPGTDDGTGTLETPDPPAPIDNYVILLAIVGILFTFMRFRAIQAKKA